MKFTRAQMQKLTLGPNYAIGLEKNNLLKS